MQDFPEPRRSRGHLETIEWHPNARRDRKKGHSEKHAHE